MEAAAPYGRGMPGPDIISTIKNAMDDLRRSERKVANTILSDLNFAIHASGSHIATRAGVSEPSVHRFSRAVGCQGLRELKLRLAQSLAVGHLYFEDPPHTSGERAKPSLWHSVFQHAHGAVDLAESQLRQEDVDSAAARLAGARRLIALGVGGGSTVLAQEAQYRFFRLGINVSSYSDSHLMRMVAATLDERDVILAISITGKPPEVIDAARIARQYGAFVVAITRGDSLLATAADIVLALDIPEVPDVLKPTAARYGFMAALDILATSTAYSDRDASRELLRRVKYAQINFDDGEVNGPIGD